MIKDKQEFLSEAQRFLTTMRDEQGCEPGGVVDVGSTDDLWNLGYLDSLNVIRFLLFLEDLIGHEIEVEEDAAKAFRTLDSVFETYVSERAAT
jgi:hypothetical protein